MAIKHRSLNENRLRDNPRERAYLQEWQDMAPTTLGYIICSQLRHEHDFSQRDAEVAASMMQWLGSNVGQGFLDGVQRKIGKR